MTANGASLPCENARVAAAMWGRADSPSRRGPAQSGLLRPRGRVDQGARLPGAVIAGSGAIAATEAAERDYRAAMAGWIQRS